MQHWSVVLPSLYLTSLWKKRFGRCYDTAFEFSKLLNLKLSRYSNWNEFPSASAHWHLLMSSARSETCVRQWASMVSVSGKEPHECTFLQQTAGDCFLRKLIDGIECQFLKFYCFHVSKQKIALIEEVYIIFSAFNYKPVLALSPQVHDPVEMYASTWIDSTAFVHKHTGMLTAVLQPVYIFFFLNNCRSTSLRSRTSQRAVTMSRLLFDAGLLMNERKLQATKWQST